MALINWKDKEAKRKYYREWARKKRAKLEGESLIEYKERRRILEENRRHKNNHKVIINVREQIKNNKLKLIDHFGGGCKLCGFSDIRALQFDHIVPLLNRHAPRVNHYLRKRDWNKILTQTEGLQLLCANCHSIKSYEEGSKHVMLRYPKVKD